jgi:hypothetical protein
MFFHELKHYLLVFLFKIGKMVHDRIVLVIILKSQLIRQANLTPIQRIAMGYLGEKREGRSKKRERNSPF